VDHLIRDVRVALRSLARNRTLTLIAASSLALGIGTASSIFSAVDVFTIRPLAYPQGDELVAVELTNGERGWADAPTSWPDFADWRDAAGSLDLAAYHGTGVNLSGGDQPERLHGLEVSAGFLETLRVRPRLGRGFLREDETASPSRVVVLGDAVWQRDFGGDPGIVGRTVSLDGAPIEVVGVLPPRFGFDGSLDLLLPLRRSADPDRGDRWLRVVGRLRPGSSLERARMEMAGVQARLAASYPGADAGTGVSVRPLRDAWFGSRFLQGSLISGIAVLLVLLIVCANVANLLLARGAAREREIALRRALGAGRGRILGQLFTESVILALAGGGLGLLLSVQGIRWIRGLLPMTMPQTDQVVLNGRVVLFTLALALGSGLLFGMAPALEGARVRLRDALAEGGRGGGAAAGRRMRRTLVVAEIALSFVLLVSATLLVQGYRGLQTKDLGFAQEHRVTARLTLSSARYPDAEERRAFFRRMEDRVAALPGVAAVGLASQFPLRGANSTFYTIPDDPPVDPARRPTTVYRDVSPGYFDAMGMTLLAGRRFGSDDVAGAPPVLVVDRAFAQRHWPDESPLGKTVEIASTVREIVGLVADTHDFGPDQDAPAVIYDPLYQADWSDATLVVETDRTEASFVPTLRETIRAIDPDQPLYSVESVRQLLQDWIGRTAAMTEVMGVLAVLAFLLATVGVYGVMAYTVARRTQEVGVRMALGARRRAVLGLVLRQGGAMAAVGVGVGLVAALGATRFLAFFLYGVSPFDPATFIGVSVLLILACLGASWVPALRATRVDPLVAIRSE
jgi:putative ABC transport system permease protein